MADNLINLLPGSIIRGRWSKKAYQVESLLGQGGCGAVYLVRGGEKQEIYALKISREQSLLNKEYHLLKELSIYPRIRTLGLVPQVYQLDDFWNGEKYYSYLVMEYVQGLNLQQLLKKKTQFKPREVVGIGLLLALALERIHQREYIYGDLKLENLLYNEENGQLRMIDLGGMSRVGESIKAFTPLYDRASWGQGSRKGDYQYDIFAFSMLLFILTVGKKLKPERGKDSLRKVFPLLPQDKEYGPLNKIIIQGLEQEYQNIASISQDLWYLWQSPQGKNSVLTSTSRLPKVVNAFLLFSLLFLFFSCCLFFS